MALLTNHVAPVAMQPGDSVYWMVHVDELGDYDVILEFSNAGNGTGGTVEFVYGSQILTYSTVNVTTMAEKTVCGPMGSLPIHLITQNTRTFLVLHGIGHILRKICGLIATAEINSLYHSGCCCMCSRRPSP